MVADASGPVVFISYAREDADVTERLLLVRKPMRLAGAVLWADSHIGVSRLWSDEIATYIERAEVAVLLVSADFLGSDYIMNEEVPRLAARGIPLVCVPVGDCGWQDIEALASRQWALPPDRPWRRMAVEDRDSALVRVLEAVRGLILAPDTAADGNGNRSDDLGPRPTPSPPPPTVPPRRQPPRPTPAPTPTPISPLTTPRPSPGPAPPDGDGGGRPAVPTAGRWVGGCVLLAAFVLAIALIVDRSPSDPDPSPTTTLPQTPPSTTPSGFVLPALGRMGQPYACGVDFDGAPGDPVHAVDDGVALEPFKYGDTTNWVIPVRHTNSEGDDFVALYALVRQPLPRGTLVTAGEQIAQIGEFGAGSHLHFALRPGTSVVASDESTCSAPHPPDSFRDQAGFVDPIAYLTTRQPG